MKTLAEQGYMPMMEAVKKCTGQEPHIQTVRRWVKKGIRGFRIEAKFVAGEYITTVDAVNDFISSVSKARLDKQGGAS